EPEVALRDELGLAERYLDLERARFGDTLSFSVEAEPDTAAAQVPSLLLQPLVENALKHGRGADGRAHVRIRAQRQGPDLRIEVRDRGSGPAEDYLLEPFDDQRFAQALARAKAHVRQCRAKSLAQQLAAALAPPARAPAPPRTLLLKDGARSTFLREDEIDWIEAQDYYVEI